MTVQQTRLREHLDVNTVCPPKLASESIGMPKLSTTGVDHERRTSASQGNRKGPVRQPLDPIQMARQREASGYQGRFPVSGTKVRTPTALWAFWSGARWPPRNLIYPQESLSGVDWSHRYYVEARCRPARQAKRCRAKKRNQYDRTTG